MGDEEESSYHYSTGDDESYDSEEDDGSSRTLLFLCEEGQIDQALNRLKDWDEQCPVRGESSTGEAQSNNNSGTVNDTSAAQEALEETIRRELFRKNPSTGNHCLHEILAGGTSGQSARSLVERLIRRYRGNYPDSESVFLAQPNGSHGRTVLHWCAWCKTSPFILRLAVEACPEALCVRDNKTHGSRTPLDIAQHYWPQDPIAEILRRSTESYLPHRLRACLRLCVVRLFGSDNDWKSSSEKGDGTVKGKAARSVNSIANPRGARGTATTKPLTPFDKADRRNAGLTPRAWFVASVLGYARQREMNNLQTHILSYVGRGARIDARKKRKRREARSVR